jgi:glucose-6-phosphate-specific signal transduction histidine kinase
MLETISNVFQILGYVIVPVLLGVGLYYGMRRTRDRKNPAAQELQDRATRRLYEAEEKERQDKARAAERSSNPIDVIERKTDTTG